VRGARALFIAYLGVLVVGIAYAVWLGLAQR
jgi:hypothetical protein